MDPNLQLLYDRIEIDDLLTRYAGAVDDRDWERLDTVFAPRAQLDYRSAGGIRGLYPEVRQWLSDVLPIFTWTQHLVANRSRGHRPGRGHGTRPFGLPQPEPDG